RGDERIRHGDDFVARPDAVGAQRELDRVEPARHADGVADTEISGKFGFELLDRAAENEVALLTDLAHGGFDGRRQGGVLNAKIDERYMRGNHVLILNPR